VDAVFARPASPALAAYVPSIRLVPNDGVGR